MAVLIYHHDNSWIAGGFLGVECFFVISGFIITRLLFDEWLNSGRLDFFSFYLRRLRRLVPGILAMVLATWTVAHVSFPDAIEQVRHDIPYSLSFTLNLNYIFNERSYFQTLDRPPMLEHLWSIGIEFQFYLIWPMLCLLLFRLRLWIAELILGCGICIATWWMAHLYNPLTDPSRIYFGTDTRVGAFLLGAGIAMAIARSKNVQWRRYHFLTLISIINIISFSLLIFLLFRLNSTNELLYQGGFIVTSISVGIIIACCHILLAQGKRNLITTLLANPFSRGLGLRAYSIYLWHWPIYCLTESGVDIALTGTWLFAFRIAVTLGLAELSYQYVEPAFRQRSQKQQKILRIGNWQFVRVSGSVAGCMLSAYLVLLVNSSIINTSSNIEETDMLNSVSSFSDNNDADEKNIGMTEMISKNKKAEALKNEESNAITIQKEQSGKLIYPVRLSLIADYFLIYQNKNGTCSQSIIQNACIPDKIVNLCSKQTDSLLAAADFSGLNNHNKKRNAGQILLTTHDHNGFITHAYTSINRRPVVNAVGDSVMIGAARELLKRIPSVAIDAQVGRQLTSGQSLLQTLRKKKRLGDVVLIHLGNNGPLAAKQIEALIHSLTDVKVIVLVNLKLPRNYETANNNLLTEISQKYPQVKLIDWRSVSLREGNIFAKDGMHLNQRGAKIYTDVIANSLSNIHVLKENMN
ncbi:acyltransferase [Desulfobulbus sp. F3]|nr:acyltransferase [Desulfobulbus sp. F3]